jgi:RNA polymerase sigma factor (sigma-70 family)
LFARAGPAGDGRCEILRHIAWTARRFLQLRYPERRTDVDDVVQEVWIRIAQGGRKGAPPRGAALRAWLRSVVMNLVTDLLRRERIVAKKRCGACVHFGQEEPKGCREAAVRDPSCGIPRENPWFGGRVDAETAPDRLDPPCLEFLWRYRPQSLEALPPGREAREPSVPERVEPPGSEVLRGLARLARRGADGVRRASIVYRHFIEEEPLDDVARSLGITSRTARRDVQRALAELREILGEEEG